MPNTREKLAELLEKLFVDYGATAIFFTKGEAEVIADHLIANRVTIPVRCEKCKHWDQKHCSDGQGWCPKVVGYRRGNWYCAGGEKIELPKITDQTRNAIEAMGKNAHREEC